MYAEPTKILLADGETAIATQLEDMLQAQGYAVAGRAMNGSDAVQLAGELKPDLVLMDIVMDGDMDGISAAEQIRRDLGIPIIFLTTCCDDDHLDRAKKTRPHGYILKPCHEGQLRACIEIALQRHREEQLLKKDLHDCRERAQNTEIRLKEIHHRIKNNLNMIIGTLTFQSRKLNDSACQEAIREIKGRISAIYHIHERLYSSDDFTTIEYADYFDGLRNSLYVSYSIPHTINLVMEAAPMRLHSQRIMLVGLIITEFVSNSLKHAFPDQDQAKGTIRIRAEKQGPLHILAMNDNGVGLPLDFDYRQCDTLGMELMHGLVEQLGGEIEISSENGVRILIRFPEE